MTKSEQNLRKKQRRNKKIALVLSVTGDSKLATLLRDRSDSYIKTFLGDWKRTKKSKKKKKQIEVLPELEERDFTKEEPIKEDRNTRRRRLYKEARDAGYTPEEAQKLRGKAKEKFNQTLQFNKIVSNQSRYERWATWGKEVAKVDKKLKQAEKENRSASIIFDLESRKNSIYPKWIQDEVEAINLEKDFDKNSSYGWNIVYYYYTEGGTIEFWKGFFMADPLNDNIYRAKDKFTPTVTNRQRRLK